MNKERRHKEATLLDITSVVAGPPLRRKKADDKNDGSLCLTVNFIRGGSVDFEFKNVETRNLWHHTLIAIINQTQH